jgi:hypothetical protein
MLRNPVLDDGAPGSFENRLPELLCRFSDRHRELDHLPTQLRGNPFHLAFVAIRNVKLDHLCHSHPPIQRATVSQSQSPGPRLSAFTCLDAESIVGGDLNAFGSQAIGEPGDRGENGVPVDIEFAGAILSFLREPQTAANKKLAHA